MRKSRERSVGPEWSREAGLRLHRLRLQRYPGVSDAAAYRMLREDILEATGDWPEPADFSPATLRSIELGRYDEDGNITTRRMEVGELKAICQATGVSADWMLGLRGNEDETDTTQYREDSESAPGAQDQLPDVKMP